ncbi:ABC-F family ATP-binding cassette domain-containing protein [Micromonospora sp. WMMD882]|uniref:ABC-F family ATP-binding cassette domain-containing protein n=1 Tax=Micromonospora sp. WMMD882 TaxID=3015151 RepID=UPI00248CCFF2|nr:ABC-F family ATP-binding cassette domain-containing protein [Micromonospora sp. WMMD882]WBB80311.1 ABC-F family ATP-binding cassette domain-containing protein [Micromonospora sp. WMMD882]
MSAQLTLRAVSKSFAHRRVFDAVSCAVRPGERVGIVGENGVGKSTLLRMIAGRDDPDDGEIIVTAAGGVGHLGQVVDLPDDSTVGDAIDAALGEIRELGRRIAAAERELGSATDERMAEYGALRTAFELRDGYRADAKVQAAMSRLGVGDLDRDRRLGTLSGGQLARLALAGVLSAEPELLLLDEPTNDLDQEAVAWLEGRLRGHHGTVVVVTHDRLLLERVATAIVEVDGDRRTVRRYGDGYAGYLAERRAARQRWEQAYAEWVGEVERWTEWGATTAYRVAPGRAIRDHNKCKYNGDGRRVQESISTRVRSAAERLGRLRAEPVPEPPEPLRLHAPLDADGLDGPVLELRDVRVDGRLDVDELVLSAGQRLLVSGPNGAGKSTLLEVASGRLRPDRGAVVRHGRIGYLPQDVPPPRPDVSLLTAFSQGRVGAPEEHRERLRSMGLFRPDDFRTPVGALSVGQRRRLALARLLDRDADLLLLDEPTNHLSLTLVEEFEAALEGYPGAVVVVSHDRMLRQRWRGGELTLRSGRLSRRTA